MKKGLSVREPGKQEGGDGRGSDSKAREISEIQKLLQERRYEEAFHFCRKLRKRYRRTPPAELLFAGICALFGLGHIHQSEEWIESLGSLAKSSHSRSLYLYPSAYLELQRGQFSQALLSWTAIVQNDPSQVFADTLIERLKSREKEIHTDLQRPEAFRRYVPLALLDSGSWGRDWGHSQGLFGRSYKNLTRLLARLGDSIPIILSASSLRILGGLALLAVGLAASFWLTASNGLLSSFWRTIRNIASSGLGTEGHSGNRGSNGSRGSAGSGVGVALNASKEGFLPTAPDSGSVLSPEQYSGIAPRFIFPDRQAALTAYDQARSLILKRQVNRARYLLGKLELSNASFEIKERALLLRSMIPILPQSQFNDPVAVAVAEAEPYIYRGAQILWRGKISSLKYGPEGLRLYLLVEGEARRPIAALLSLRQGRWEESLQKLKIGATIEIFGLLRLQEQQKGLLIEAEEEAITIANPKGR